MSNVTFQVESFSKVRPEVNELILAHWEEIALNKDTVPLDPDWDTYYKADAGGVLHLVTARDGEKLVGYSVYIVTTNLHYRSLTVADTDIFYLSPSYRKGMCGVRLIKFSEESLKGRGVNKIITKAKLHNQVGSLLEKIGYTPIETVYAKSI